MAKVFVAISGIIFSLFSLSPAFGANAPVTPGEGIATSNLYLESPTHATLVGQVAPGHVTEVSSATLISQPLYGVVALDSDGSFTYKPNEGFQGIDSFISEICDNEGNCTQTVVYVDVLPDELVLGDLIPDQNFEACEMADGSVQLLQTEKASQQGNDTYYIYHADAMGHQASTLIGLSHKDALPKASQLIRQVAKDDMARLPGDELMTWFE